MAYNGRQGQHQEVQYSSRPQGHESQYNGYDQGQYDQRHAGYQAEIDQGYQQGAYGSNQQYTQHYDMNGPQHIEQAEHSHYASTYQHVPAEQEQRGQQPRQYQYDDRYRTNGRGAREHGNAARRSGESRPTPLASRPGTSASNRRLKRRSLR